MKFLLFGLLFLLPGSVLGQGSVGLTAGAGVYYGEFSEAFHTTGGITTGVALFMPDFVAFGDLSIILVPERSARYLFDPATGQCRDGNNGQLVEADLCSSEGTGLGASLDVNYAPNQSAMFVGAGYRHGQLTSPYVSIGLRTGARRAAPLGLLAKVGFWTNYFAFSGAVRYSF